MKRGKLAVISGPSAGVGKDTMLRLFLEKNPDWHQPPSATTRDPRKGEIAGRDMNFLSKIEFEQLQNDNKFLETDFHANNWYGTLAEPVEKRLSKGQNVMLRIDVNGALIVKQKIPEAVLIFITAESLEVLQQRLKARGSESETQMVERLELAKQEMLLADKFDHTVINADGQQAQAQKDIEAILL